MSEEKIPLRLKKYDITLQNELNENWMLLLNACKQLHERHPKNSIKEIVREATGATLLLIQKMKK